MTHSCPVRSVLVGWTLALFASSLLLSAYADEEQTLEFLQSAQGFGQDTIVELQSKSIEQGPSSTLFSGTGDVSATGSCAEDLDRFCATTRPGEGRIALCLTEQLEQESKGTVQGEKLTGDCKEELAEFKIDRGTTINKNIPLAEACQADAKAVCSDESSPIIVDSDDPADPIKVFACLRSAAAGTWWTWRDSLPWTVAGHWRDRKAQLSQPCAAEIFKTQMDGALDYRTDAELHTACEPDAKQICPNVTPEEGRVQDCLRDHLGQVSWECQVQLFRQEMENAGDIRLSPRLLQKCRADNERFCPDVQPGNARVEDCLEEHREDQGFSTECKEEFEAMMEARAADFRLDSSLREKCFDDIQDVCGYERDSLDSVKDDDARVIQCLRDHRDELQQPSCQEQVQLLTKRASEDIRFDVPLARVCSKDRTRLCNGIQGSPWVFHCLREHREELSYECRAALFHAEVRMTKDGDYKYPMRRACAYELKLLCPGLPHGSARYTRCLQLHQNNDAMSSVCKEALSSDTLMRSD